MNGGLTYLLQDGLKPFFKYDCEIFGNKTFNSQTTAVNLVFALSLIKIFLNAVTFIYKPCLFLVFLKKLSGFLTLPPSR